MRKLMLLCALVCSSNAFAQSSPSDRHVVSSGFVLAPGEKIIAVNGVPVAQETVCQGRPVVAGSVAQAKAQQQAAEGRMRHVGGGMGAGSYEGVGFSTVSAEHAVSKCCYWGQRKAIDIGVARGRNGWYATVIYR
jgi:hypothetical protein